MIRILCTGGAGFLGRELIKKLYVDKENSIRVVSRNETSLVKLKQLYPNVEIIVGDIRDKFTCDKACKDVDEIYHLAAMKHIGLAEQHPRECIESNVIGTLNILEATRKYKPKFILGISTDKAAQVNGVYGATKMLMERLFAEYEKINPDTDYRLVRYGNVLGSSGSVITKWKPLMEQGKEVIITDPEATRFFFTAEDAVQLIFECLMKSDDSTPYIPEMKAISMGDMLKACQKKYGNCPVKTIGLQEGENKHETVDGVTFSNEVYQYTIDEFITKFL